MVCFGAIVVEPTLRKTFYDRLRPVCDTWNAEALAVSGYTRDETLKFDDPGVVMERFAEWVGSVSHRRPCFVSDNSGFDWQFINWYFWHFLGDIPFGHSSTNLGSLYKGIVKDVFLTFAYLKKTAHTHHPLDDARGNAEALLALKAEYGLKISPT